jgi:hypothetical protein
MKRRVLLVSMAVVLLVVSISASICAVGTFKTIQSQGTINYNPYPLTVLLRGLTLTNVNPSQNLTQYVNNYVGNYTFAQNTIIIFGDLHIGGILQYPKQFNATYGTWADCGLTWNQLETLIDAFHSHGWKVWWGGTDIAWDNEWVQSFIRQNPELGFTDANGYTANDVTTNGAGNGKPSGNKAGNKTVSSDALIPDVWANFTAAVPSLGIANNTRLIDVIATKLGQMIGAGLQFDGWMPSDGWNGFNIWGYNFPGSGSGGYSFSYQEETEWQKDTISGFGLPSIGQPSGWSSWNITQRANWIITNTTASNVWHEWWCYRFSKMYLQIKNTIKNNNPTPQNFYTMVGADGSCQWASGNLGSQGLLNFTMVANDVSIDRFQVDPENTYVTPKYDEMPKEDAWVAGLVKAKDPRLTPLIGIQATSFYDSVTAVPLWDMEQQYLAQVQNYVWFNGTRYSACNRTDISLQYPPENPPSSGINWATSSWNNTAVHALFNFIDSVSSIFLRKDLTPAYLGPTLVLPYAYDGWVGQVFPNSINYTFAQFADQYNLQKSNSYIASGMGTILLDQANLFSSLSQGQQNVIDNMFANGTLNVISVFCNGQNDPVAQISSMFISGSESKVVSTFKLNFATGSSTIANILNQSNIQNSIAKWIASGYNWKSWSTSSTSVTWYGVYQTLSGFIPIANFTDNRISIGIYYNASSGKFLYMDNPFGCANINNFGPLAPEQVVNRAIYWASNSPINSSQSMIDYKVFKLGDGTIVIPMMNHNCTTYSTWNGKQISSTLQINAAQLGLGNPSNYNIGWVGGYPTSISSWSSVPITLNGMAGVLIITPK